MKMNKITEKYPNRDYFFLLVSLVWLHFLGAYWHFSFMLFVQTLSPAYFILIWPYNKWPWPMFELPMFEPYLFKDGQPIFEGVLLTNWYDYTLSI